MNNFPNCVKSIEKIGVKLYTFTATELCFFLFISLHRPPCSYLTYVSEVK